MNIFDDFNYEAAKILEKLKKRISSYPSSLKDLAIDYLEKRGISAKVGNQKCRVYYLIPFWLKDPFKLTTEWCIAMALGNIFGLLYYLSQDEVMDGNSTENKAELLTLSSMFYFDFISQYRILFPPHSPFWKYFEKYTGEWIYSVLWERKEHIGKAAPYSEQDLILLSRKAAPLKIPFAAISILANRPEAIDAFSDMVDFDQVVYQMYDDWRDWREDLLKGNYTCFLLEALKYSNISESALLNEALVRQAIYKGSILSKVFQQSKKYNRMAAESIKSMNLPYLEEYIRYQDEHCIRLPLNSLDMIRGGFKNQGLGSLLLYSSNSD